MIGAIVITLSAPVGLNRRPVGGPTQTRAWGMSLHTYL